MKPHGYERQLVGMLLCLLARGAHAHPVLVQVMAQEGVAPKWIANAHRADGICPDIIAAIERAEPRLHFAGRVQGRSLATIEAGLGTGAVDAACALVDSPRRRQVGEMVGPPLYLIRHRLAGRMQDGASVRGVADLVRLRALVDTASGSAFVGQMKLAGVPVDGSSGDNLLNLRKVLAGHGRFAYMNELVLQRLIRTQGWQDRVRVLPLVVEEPARFWVSRKAPPEVGRLIGDALARIKASGELGRIYVAWTRAPVAAQRVAAQSAR